MDPRLSPAFQWILRCAEEEEKEEEEELCCCVAPDERGASGRKGRGSVAIYLWLLAPDYCTEEEKRRSKTRRQR